MPHHDLIEPDEATVRKFLELLHARAAAALSHLRRPGVLQVVSISPDDRGMSFSPFAIGDVDSMLDAVLIDARSGRNTFIEPRSVRPGRPKERKQGRGKAEATIGLFAFVIDSDADKGQAGRVDHLNGDASAIVETSPGNRHIWLFLHRALSATDAKPLGDRIRKASGADHNTGTVTQPYRIPGTPNYPDAKKRERGRTVVTTKLIAVSDRLWVPSEIEATFPIDGTQAAKTKLIRKATGSLGRSATQPSNLRREAIAKAKIGAKVNLQTDRSAAFQSAVNAAVRAGMSADEIETEMRKNPDGPQQKYLEATDRLRAEIDRSCAKVESHEVEQGSKPAADPSIDGAELLDRVYEFLGRFVVYPSKDAHAAHTLWVAHAHFMNAWETTPRLAFLSPEPASGKSRALEVSELLVPRATPAINVSPAYLVRKVQAEEGLPTVLFDGIDAVFGPKARDGNEDVRALLNAGYRRGATVGRCVMHGSVAVPEDLPAFCAIALAGLGDLPDTVLSRSIVIRMRRRAPTESVLPFRRRLYAEEGQRLNDHLGAWAAAVISRITEPEMPAEIIDRDADCWEPLIAAADAAGGHWPDTVRRCAVALVELLRGDGEERLSIRLLSDMRVVLRDDDQAPTSAILDKLHKLDEAPWGDIKGKPLNDRGLAVRLRPYGIKSRVIRVGSTTPRGYRREDFVDAWTRYLPPPPTP
jgi:hypothetical protein